ETQRSQSSECFLIKNSFLCALRASAVNFPSPFHHSWPKIRVVTIFIGDHSNLERPLNAKSRIVPSQSPRMSRSIEFGHLIEYFRVLIESEKTMSEPLGDVQHSPILRRKLCGQPLSEGGTVGTQINNYVVNGSHRATDQFRFFGGDGLIMHPTERRFLLIE